jgi:pantetheine-phosphate adenylyltransferase
MFPGSFDPITVGHKDVALRAASVFDEIIIAVGYNTEKKGFFTVEERVNMLKEIFNDISNIKIESFSGLTVDFCRKSGAKYLIRGIRSASDFDFEKSIAGMNSILAEEIETIFFLSKPEFSTINSTVVREILKNKGDIKGFVPAEVLNFV